MHRTIVIQGKDHPIAFNNRAIGTWSHAMKIPLKAFAQVEEDITLLQTVHLLYHCLQEGYRQTKKEFLITIDDCWNFTDTEDGILGRVFEMLRESRQADVRDEEGKEEKKTES